MLIATSVNPNPIIIQSKANGWVALLWYELCAGRGSDKKKSEPPPTITVPVELLAVHEDLPPSAAIW